MTPLASWALYSLCFGALVAFYALLVIGLDSYDSDGVSGTEKVREFDQQRRKAS